MKGSFSDVLKIYQNEVEILGCFTEISEGKSEALKRNRVEELDKIIRTEEVLLMKFAVLEKKKQKILEIIKAQYGIDSKISNELIRRNMTEEEYENLGKLRRRFTGILDKQEKSTYINRKIIQQRNESIDMLLNEIEDKNHSATVVNKSSLLDRRA